MLKQSLNHPKLQLTKVHLASKKNHFNILYRYFDAFPHIHLLLFLSLLFIRPSFYHFKIVFVSEFSANTAPSAFDEIAVGYKWKIVHVLYDVVYIVMLFWDGRSFAAAIHLDSILSIIISTIVYTFVYLTPSSPSLRAEGFRIVFPNIVFAYCSTVYKEEYVNLFIIWNRIFHEKKKAKFEEKIFIL